mmetsp:Transcript_59185/g.117572  ORF Transcript_59185/g.117572 Transcript_59185/m.117572 type:complete len:98 (+) Transcript_59185:364-657(+)
MHLLKCMLSGLPLAVSMAVSSAHLLRDRGSCDGQIAHYDVHAYTRARFRMLVVRLITSLCGAASAQRSQASPLSASSVLEFLFRVPEAPRRTRRRSF